MLTNNKINRAAIESIDAARRAISTGTVITAGCHRQRKPWDIAVITRVVVVYTFTCAHSARRTAAAAAAVGSLQRASFLGVLAGDVSLIIILTALIKYSCDRVWAGAEVCINFSEFSFFFFNLYVCVRLVLYKTAIL